MRIRIINPVKRKDLTEASMPVVPDWAGIEVDWLPEGPTAIESRADDARVQPLVLDRIALAVADGVDGIVINCFMDPAVEPARELITIPIMGPGQASMVVAATLGDRFSVILPAVSGAPIATKQARAYVGLDRVASVRGVEMPVSELYDEERLLDNLVNEAMAAIEKDGADVVILGCTGMSYITDVVRERLAPTGVPILDPTLSAIGLVATQIIQGVGPSRLAYALPSWLEKAV